MMRRDNHQIALVRGNEFIYALAGTAWMHRNLQDLHAGTSRNCFRRLLGVHLPPRGEQFAHMRLRIEIAALSVFGDMEDIEPRLRRERKGHGVCEGLHTCSGQIRRMVIVLIKNCVTIGAPECINLRPRSVHDMIQIKAGQLGNPRPQPLVILSHPEFVAVKAAGTFPIAPLLDCGPDSRQFDIED